MENPVPDLIYYQRIVDNWRINDASIVKSELKDLIEEVKKYISAVNRRICEISNNINE